MVTYQLCHGRSPLPGRTHEVGDGLGDDSVTGRCPVLVALVVEQSLAARVSLAERRHQFEEGRAEPGGDLLKLAVRERPIEAGPPAAVAAGDAAPGLI